MVSCDVTGGITLGTKLKMPIFTFYLPYNLQSRVLVFKSLCNWDTVSNRTYQNFLDKRLVRPGSKYPNWKRSQTIICKAKLSQRYNIYSVDLRYNITYQLRSDHFLYHQMPKMAKTLPYNLHGWAFYKIEKFVSTKKSYQ